VLPKLSQNGGIDIFIGHTLWQNSSYNTLKLFFSKKKSSSSSFVGSSPAASVSVSGREASYVWTGVKSGVKWFVRVAAHNSWGSAEYTNNSTDPYIVPDGKCQVMQES